jgi:N-acetylated-alpha-linked acidic dipeptidase
MRTIISLAAVGLLCTGISFGAPALAPSDESAIERNFDTLVQPNDLRDWMKLLAAEPNHVGSPHDKTNAEQILAWFKGWGWDAHIETFQVLYPTILRKNYALDW